MEFKILLTNLSNPTILFFLLGVIAVWWKSDLQVPASSSRFISLYLLFSIGFKGGQELSHSGFSTEVMYSILFGVGLAICIPIYLYFILRRRLNVYDSAAVAACYGSVSAITFVSAATFLELQKIEFGGHMVAVMALMEAPAIIIGVILMMKFSERTGSETGMGKIIHHSFTNGSVLMIMGSLLIGLISDARQAEGIKPFTTDIFKGFLAIFLLEMGMVTARRFGSFLKYGWFVSLFALLVPAVNGCLVAWCSQIVTEDIGNRFIFAVLAASASYIAVPAAMRMAAPKADPGLYVPMALGVTFPFNITIGMPVYYIIIQATMS